MINNASKNTSGETESVRLDVGGRLSRFHAL